MDCTVQVPAVAVHGAELALLLSLVPSCCLLKEALLFIDFKEVAKPGRFLWALKHLPEVVETSKAQFLLRVYCLANLSKKRKNSNNKKGGSFKTSKYN